MWLSYYPLQGHQSSYFFIVICNVTFLVTCYFTEMKLWRFQIPRKHMLIKRYNHGFGGNGIVVRVLESQSMRSWFKTARWIYQNKILELKKKSIKLHTKFMRQQSLKIVIFGSPLETKLTRIYDIFKVSFQQRMLDCSN